MLRFTKCTRDILSETINYIYFNLFLCYIKKSRLEGQSHNVEEEVTTLENFQLPLFSFSYGSLTSMPDQGKSFDRFKHANGKEAHRELPRSNPRFFKLPMLNVQ